MQSQATSPFPSGPGLARYRQRLRPSVTWAMVSGLSPGARGFGLDVDETPVPHSGPRSPRLQGNSHIAGSVPEFPHQRDTCLFPCKQLRALRVDW